MNTVFIFFSMLYLHFNINFNTIISLTSCQLHDSLLMNFIKWNISHLAYQWWGGFKKSIKKKLNILKTNIAAIYL